KNNGTKVIIGGAGGAAHLPGMLASMANVPVIGGPSQSKAYSGGDSLYPIRQMPGGIPVATMPPCAAGHQHDGTVQAELVGIENSDVYERLEEYTKSLEQKVEDMQNDLK